MPQPRRPHILLSLCLALAASLLAARWLSTGRVADGARLSQAREAATPVPAVADPAPSNPGAGTDPAADATPRPLGWSITPLEGGGREIELHTPAAARLPGEHGLGLSVAGLESWAASGQPDLPGFVHAFEVPPGYTARLAVVVEDTTDNPGVRLAPRPGWTTVTRDGENFERVPSHRPDAALYERPEFWPGEPGSITTATAGTQTFARVVLHPFQYQPVAGVLRRHGGLKARVELVPAERLAVTALSHPMAIITNACECVERVWRPATWWPQVNGNPGDFAARRAGAAVDACVKIRITKQGPHKLTRDNLVAAGIPAASLVGANLRLFFRDREVAIQPTSEGLWVSGDYLLFYAEPFSSYHTRDNFVWLGFGAGGRRVATRAAAPLDNGAPESTSACRRQTLASRAVYSPSLPATLGALALQGGYDGWFQGTVAEPGNPTYPAVSLLFTNTDRSVGGTATLSALLWGISVVDLEGALNGANHQVQFKGHTGGLIQQFVYPVVSRNPVSVSFPTTHLAASGSLSILSAVANPIPGVDFDRSGLSWTRLEFTRELYAISDQLHFGGQAGARDYRVRGFSTTGAKVWDLHDPWEPVELSATAAFTDGAFQGVRFGESLGYDACYLAFRPAVAQTIATADISQTRVGTLADPTRQADYLVLTPSSFASQVHRLLERRDQEGLTVAVAELEDIYNEFGYGVRDPNAIRQFLGYAFHHWGGPPGRPLRYVALAGDGTFDPQNILITDPNPFPVPLASTHFLYTAVDQWYAAVSGADTLADFAIGRFPAESLAHLQRMLDKQQAQEDLLLGGSTGAWRTSLHLVSGNPQSVGENFVADSNNLASQILAPVATATTSPVLSQADATTARTVIPNAYTSGRLFVNYFGHGATDRWVEYSSPSAFESTLAAGMANTILPVTTVYTCKNGLFQEPRISTSGTRKNALVEALLRETTGGSPAAIAPTGEALHAVSLPIAREFYNAAINRRVVSSYSSTTGFTYTTVSSLRLGDALLNGFKAVFLSLSESARELEFYQVFGDPAYRIQKD